MKKEFADISKLPGYYRDEMLNFSGKSFLVFDGEIVKHEFGDDGDVPPSLLRELVGNNPDTGWYVVPDKEQMEIASQQADLILFVKKHGNPWEKDTFNLTRQIEIARDAPDFAKRLKDNAAHRMAA